MTDLGSLLLPIIVSAVAVFIASSIIHMGPFWHKRDYPALPDEDRFRAAVGPLDIPPGDYMVPRCYSAAEMKSQEFQSKVAQGPNVILTVMPKGPFGMGAQLGQWFVFILVVSIFAAYGCIGSDASSSFPDRPASSPATASRASRSRFAAW